jgi:transposase, IS6 family
LSVVSRPTTSPSSAGCTASLRFWPTRPGSAGHAPGDKWFTDETYVKVNDVWRYVYRAVDQDGQVIDVLVSARRDAAAARSSSAGAADVGHESGGHVAAVAMATVKVRSTEVVTDAAPVYPAVLDELVPWAWHHVRTPCNNRVEADHSQLKHRLRPMRGYGPTGQHRRSSPGTP